MDDEMRLRPTNMAAQMVAANVFSRNAARVNVARKIVHAKRNTKSCL